MESVVKIHKNDCEDVNQKTRQISPFDAPGKMHRFGLWVPATTNLASVNYILRKMVVMRPDEVECLCEFVAHLQD